MEDHAQAILDLASRLGEVLAGALVKEHPITGSLLGPGELAREALAGTFQYGLVFCALEKCRLNQAAGAAYFGDLCLAVERKVADLAEAGADRILVPLAHVADAGEISDIAQTAYDPLKPYEGTSLTRLDSGLAGTPVEVITKQIITRFYAGGEQGPVAARVVDLSFQAIKILFTDGGLAS